MCTQGKGEEYNAEHWLFWFGCSISVPMILIIVVWVRKSYRRFPTTQIFPLELGALTIVSVNGTCPCHVHVLRAFSGFQGQRVSLLCFEFL
jgi:hypothetical protein